MLKSKKRANEKPADKSTSLDYEAEQIANLKHNLAIILEKTPKIDEYLKMAAELIDKYKAQRDAVLANNKILTERLKRWDSYKPALAQKRAEYLSICDQVGKLSAENEALKAKLAKFEPQADKINITPHTPLFNIDLLAGFDFDPLHDFIPEGLLDENFDEISRTSNSNRESASSSSSGDEKRRKLAYN